MLLFTFVQNLLKKATYNALRRCPELECSETASFCDCFLEGQEGNEVIEF